MIIIILWRYKDEQDISHGILITPELVEKSDNAKLFLVCRGIYLLVEIET